MTSGRISGAWLQQMSSCASTAAMPLPADASRLVASATPAAGLDGSDGRAEEQRIPTAAAQACTTPISASGGEDALSESAKKTLKDAKEMLPPCLAVLLDPKYSKDSRVSACKESRRDCSR